MTHAHESLFRQVLGFVNKIQELLQQLSSEHAKVLQLMMITHDDEDCDDDDDDIGDRV